MQVSLDSCLADKRVFVLRQSDPSSEGACLSCSMVRIICVVRRPYQANRLRPGTSVADPEYFRSAVFLAVRRFTQLRLDLETSVRPTGNGAG